MIPRKYYEPRKDLIESALENALSFEKGTPEELIKAIRYSVFNNGKRFRPILLFTVYEMLLNKKSIKSLKNVEACAVAIELMHTAYQIHEDLPDISDNDERRGELPNHRVFGEATAILAGDALITKAIEIVAAIPDTEKALKCVNVLTRAASTRGMIGGQAVNILSKEKKIRLNVLRYIHMKKLGSTIQAAVELACIMAEAEDNQTIMFSNFAMNLALSYQIVEELLAEFGTYDDFGAVSQGSEHTSGKPTYPGLLGTEKAKKMVQKMLDDLYRVIKSLPGNDILVEMINVIKERIPE
ncbi:MAG: polyprenyl synthetase family protein [Candidatus Cloacimonetes bacterium]|nr:polyprenyl synthetase family protein [Candidatus Cloacimonadota bacterium]